MHSNEKIGAELLSEAQLLEMERKIVKEQAEKIQFAKRQIAELEMKLEEMQDIINHFKLLI